MVAPRLVARMVEVVAGWMVGAANMEAQAAERPAATEELRRVARWAAQVVWEALAAEWTEGSTVTEWPVVAEEAVAGRQAAAVRTAPMAAAASAVAMAATALGLWAVKAAPRPVGRWAALVLMVARVAVRQAVRADQQEGRAALRQADRRAALEEACRVVQVEPLPVGKLVVMAVEWQAVMEGLHLADRWAALAA